MDYRELQGVLFGLAMAQDVILPSEWQTYVFGEDGGEFSSEKQAQKIMGCLFNALGRTIQPRIRKIMLNRMGALSYWLRNLLISCW